MLKETVEGEGVKVVDETILIVIEASGDVANSANPSGTVLF